MTNARKRFQCNRRLVVVLLLAVLAIAGCRTKGDGYIPVAAIARHGFLSDPDTLVEAQGRNIKLWGYVVHANLYGDAVAKSILGEWWGGEAPTPGTWRFNLKASDNDKVGHSFAVVVANDPGRHHILERLAADAKAQRPTRVFVSGKLFRFDAPTQFRTHIGLQMYVVSSDDIRLEER